MFSRLFRSTILKRMSIGVGGRRFFCNNGSKAREKMEENSAYLDSILKNPWVQRMVSRAAVRVVVGGIFAWCSSTFVVLSFADIMRYRRTVNAFYETNGRVADIVIHREEEEALVSKLITTPSKMGIVYGKNGAGKSHMVSNVCDKIDEPTMYHEIRDPDQFMKEFVEKICYYRNEDVTLSNYLKWINPLFALGKHPKPDITVEDMIVHLNRCEKWLERVQRYPWYVLYSVVKPLLLPCFFRLVCKDSGKRKTSKKINKTTHKTPIGIVYAMLIKENYVLY